MSASRSQTLISVFWDTMSLSYNYYAIYLSIQGTSMDTMYEGYNIHCFNYTPASL